MQNGRQEETSDSIKKALVTPAGQGLGPVVISEMLVLVEWSLRGTSETLAPVTVY